VLGFLLAAVALYTAFALLLEDSRGREVLPIGRQGAVRQAGSVKYHERREARERV
jgi:uncharacterized protein